MPISGSPTQVATSVTNAAALRAIISAQFKKGEVALLSAPPAGSPTPFYNLNPTSTMFDDGVTAIAALDGGMWERADFFVFGSATLVVATSTALPNPATIGDAVLAYVQSQRAWYRVEQGTWQRLPVADPSWQLQAAWFIDQTNGNDDNAGGNGAGTAGPLKTLAELRARLYVGSRALIKTQVTVTITTATFAEDFVFYADLTSAGALILQGTRTGISNRAWTAFTNRVKATNTPNQGTDAGGVQGANVGALIIDTQAGANSGAAAWILADQGAGVARLSTFLTFNAFTSGLFPIERTPANTDSYQIASLTAITGAFDIDIQGVFGLSVGSGKVQIDSFNIASASGVGALRGGRGALCFLTNCVVTASSGFQFSGFHLINVLQAVGGLLTVNTSPSGATFISGGAALGGNLNLVNCGNVQLRAGYIVQASGGNGILRLVGLVSANISDCGLFDGPAGGQLQTIDGATAILTAGGCLWGSTAVAGSQKLDCQTGEVLNESSGTWALAVPLATVVATLPSAGSTTGAPVSATTWAQLAVQNITIANLDLGTGANGFGGRYSNPRAFSVYGRTDVV